MRDRRKAASCGQRAPGRKQAAILALLFSAIFSGSAALAHVIAGNHRVFENSNFCLDGRAELSHGSGGGYALSTGYSLQDGPQFDQNCGRGYNVVPNRLANRNVLLKWRPGQQDWAVCVNGDWNYNSSTRSNNTKTSVYRTPCNSGYYSNSGGAYIDHGNGWRGGYVWSGSHSLPVQ